MRLLLKNEQRGTHIAHTPSMVCKHDDTCRVFMFTYIRRFKERSRSHPQQFCMRADFKTKSVCCPTSHLVYM